MIPTEFCANCDELIVFSHELGAWYHHKTGVTCCGGYDDKWSDEHVAELKVAESTPGPSPASTLPTLAEPVPPVYAEHWRRKQAKQARRIKPSPALPREEK